jgi:flagellar biogenesis protein FliO
MTHFTLLGKEQNGAENGVQKKEKYSMNQSAAFVFVVVCFILSCIVIAKYILLPFFKQYPTLEKAHEAIMHLSLVRLITQFFK